jgi:hypothetical protein
LDRTAKLATAAGAFTLAATGLAGFAGASPDAAQDGLTKAAEHVGIDLPASHDLHPTADAHPGGTPASPEVTTGQPADTHGAEVSEVARTTEATGAEKGAVVSEVARQGHGGGADVANDHAAVEVPASGGTTTAAEASDGASEAGADNADDAADAGSENAGEHGP